jgi:putative ABC transport system permease protein
VNLRLAVRKLARRPLFSLTTILCLALGIGATTAIASIVNTLFLQSGSVRDLDRVVFFMAMRENVEPFGVSPIEIEAYGARSQSFERMGVARTIEGSSVNLTGSDRPERVRAVQASTAYFETLGVAPAVGRLFAPEEERSGGPGALLMGHALWHRRFGGEPGMLGRSLLVNGELRTVVGILEPGFDLPGKAELWLPLALDFERLSERQRGSHAYMMVGRLEDGVARERALAELEGIASDLQREFPRTNAGWSVALIPFRDFMLGDFQGGIRLTILALAGAVLLLLVIACVNAAHLFLARFVEQEREIALAAALGASGRALLSQVLLESFLLALAAGALGSAVAMAILPAFLAGSPIHEGAYTNFFRAVAIDSRVLLLALGTSAATAFLFGVVPVLGSLGKDPVRSLREGGRSGEGPARARWSRMLVVTEVAVSALLLVGAGLLFRSFERLTRLDLGFRPESLVSVDFTLPASDFDQERRVAFMRDVLENVRALPGVAAAGTTTDLPLRQSTWDSRYYIEGTPPPEEGEVRWTAFRVVSPGYLEALSVTPLAGRTFTDEDRVGAAQVAIVSESLVKRELGDTDPIGRRIARAPDVGEDEYWTIVGVVKDVKEDRSNYRIDRPVWYVPYAQAGETGVLLSLLIRTGGDASATANDVRRVVSELYPQVAPGEVLELESHVSSVLAAESLATVVALALAVVGTALAAFGLYGVMAYSVRQRFRELGLRVAIGASPSDLNRLVLGHGLKWTTVGLLVGFAGAFLLSRLMSSLLFETSAADPLVYAAVAVVFLAVTFSACYLPARRASGTNPAEALRSD